MGFLKVLKQPVWKYTLKWTRYLISIFIVSFDLYEHVLTTSLEKRKFNFPRLYSWSSLYCHYGISNILLHHPNFLPKNPDISVRWFLLKSVLKQMWAQRDGRVSKSKWEPFYWHINHQSRVIPEQRWKVLSISLKLWTNGSGSEEQCVIMSDLFPNCHRSDTYKF